MRIGSIIVIHSGIAGIVIALTAALTFSGQPDKHILRKENIISLWVHTEKEPIIFAASEDEVYKSFDAGANWQRIFSLRIPNKKINKMCGDPLDGNIVYVATQDGLYETKNGGEAWQRIFRGRSDLENDCLSVAKTGTILYLGTKEGLFKSGDEGKQWNKEFDQLSDSVISSVVADYHRAGEIYLACEKGIFSTKNNGRELQRIYVIYGSEIPSEDFSDENGEISDKAIFVTGLAPSHSDPHRLYVATTKGVYVTEDDGAHWSRLPTIGLSSFNVRAIMLSGDDELFAATDRGAFRYTDKQWQKISSGLAYQEVNDLKSDSKGALWLAGRGGVYTILAGNYLQSNNAPNTPFDLQGDDIKHLFEGEPGIAAVQRAAIEYAEVNIDKIRSWRKQAQLKALFPSVSVNYDKNVYGSSTGTMAVGPRDWGLGLSWDVADLIWNNDQTSIDSRSRLLVQLRQDVLDQVTHLFYERQRIKLELSVLPLENKQERFLKELELKEITANIDALTDGYFSQNVKADSKVLDSLF